MIANEIEMSQASGQPQNVDGKCVAAHARDDSMKTGGPEETSEGGLHWHRQCLPGAVHLEAEHPKNPSISNTLDQPYESRFLVGPNLQPPDA